MMQTWQFIDPKLAQKHLNLTKQISQLQQQRKNIDSNKKINKQSKNKLLAYNQECVDNLTALLKKQEEFMINYFDQQVNVLTKNQIGAVRQNRSVNKRDSKDKVRVHCVSKDKMRGKEKQNEQNKKQSNIEKQEMGNFIQNYYKIDRHKNKSKNGNSLSDWQKSQYCDKNETLSTNLNQTRLINESHDDLQRKSYDNLKTTDRKHHTQSHQYQNNNKKKHNRASKTRATFKKLKRYCKIYKRKAQFYQLTNRHSQLMLQSIQKQNSENIELIQLLRKKIQLQNMQKEKEIERAIEEIKTQYEHKLEKIINDYDKLGKIRCHNQELGMRRKELLKQMSKNK